MTGGGGGATEPVLTGLVAQFDFQQGANPTKLYEISGTGLQGDLYGGATWILGGQAVHFDGASGTYGKWPNVVSPDGAANVWFNVFASTDLAFNNGQAIWTVAGNAHNSVSVRRTGGLLGATLITNDYAATNNIFDDTVAVTVNKPVLIASRRKDGELAMWVREEGRTAVKATKVPSPLSAVAGNPEIYFGTTFGGVIANLRGNLYWSQWHVADLSDADVEQAMRWIAERVALKGVTV